MGERVLVEVRLRARTLFGEGVETVGWQKQQKLRRAAQWYQQERDFWGDMRFDVVSIVDAPGTEPVITHVPDAFGE